MSWQASAAVEEVTVPDPTAKLILLILSNYADPFGESIFPKVERLAKKAGISERTCRYWMKYLRDHDFIQVVQQAVRHQPTHYRLSPWIMGQGVRNGGQNLPPARGAGSAPLEKPEPKKEKSRGAGKSNLGVQNAAPPIQLPVQQPVTTPPISPPEDDDELDDAIPETNGTNYSPAYLAFFAQYPKGHGSKKAAFAEWQRINPNRAKVKEIMEGLAAWHRSQRWKEGFILDAERWLKREMWENPAPPPVDGMSGVELVLAYNKHYYSRADVFQQEGIIYPKKGAIPVSS